MKRFFSLYAIVVTLCGCQGAPQYAGQRSRADNELNLGWGRSLRFGSEVDATMKGFKTQNGTKIDEIVFKQSPAATMANGWVPAMDAYGRQQVNFVPILKQYGDNAIGITDAVFNGLNQLAQTAMPAVSSYITGRTSVALAKQQTKQMQTEVIGGIAGGLLNPGEALAVLAATPPDVAAAVLSDPVVIAKLEQMQAQLDAMLLRIPASQPAAGD